MSLRSIPAGRGAGPSEITMPMLLRTVSLKACFGTSFQISTDFYVTRLVFTFIIY